MPAPGLSPPVERTVVLPAMPSVSIPPIVLTRSPDGGIIALAGSLDRHTVPFVHAELMDAVNARAGKSLALDLLAMRHIDSAGAAMLGALSRLAGERRTNLTVAAMSAEAKDALEAFRFEPTHAPPIERPGIFERAGDTAVARWRGLVGLIVLTADTFWLTFAGAPRTRRVRRGATWIEAVRIGVDAFWIVGLISFLIGVVVGLQSAAQLRQFGASLYVADLIAISMTREMGPLMTAIIIAGRSGAAIAAEAATMQVSQEVDALRTMGLNPVRYIIVPKFLAMTLTLPCLTIFASALGIAGGFMVALFYLDIGVQTYWTQAVKAIDLADVLLGFVKSVAFAWIIVLLAAHRGFSAQGGAESVGRVTTTAVVSSIFWVIIADAIFGLFFFSA